VTPLRGLQKYLRGGASLVLLLADTGAALTLRTLAASRPLWFVLIAAAGLLVLEFGFFLVTPRLLLDLPFARPDLIPGAAAAIGIVATFWVWIAAVMGFYWERKAGPATVAAMEELSADISTA
jgi:hypothetical protein